MAGWIKLHRKLKEWEWYSDTNTTRVFIHLLLSVNHEDGSHQGTVIPAGSVKTGRVSLAGKLGLSEQQTRRALNNLQKSQDITIKATNKYSIIAVNNWDCYQQSNQQTASKDAGKQPAKEPIDNHKQEGKKKERKKFIAPSVAEVKQYVSERVAQGKPFIDAERFVDSYTAKGWMVGKSKVKDWKACVRTWEKNAFNTTPPTSQLSAQEIMKDL